MSEGWDLLLVGGALATMREGAEPYGVVPDGAIGCRGGRLVFVGPRSELPAEASGAAQVIELEGAWVTPGLIDCHSHLVYAGNRAGEFERRLQGASYEEIARAGGGIRSTVRAVRAADEPRLYQESAPRLRAMQAEGLTTIEIKSGYGLEKEAEARMLRTARRLGDELGARVRTTFLGAHAVPEEFEGRADDYLDVVIEDMLPFVAREGLADAVDAFCEGIGFSPAQVERLFAAARELGLPVKLHAEQLSDLRGAVLAARHGALSADHLEYLAENDVPELAAAGTVAVLLPGAFYFLQEQRRPPVAALRAAGVPIAVATDCNPGSSPLSSPLLAMNLACTLFGLTPEESLAGFTRVAARALGLQEEIGTLADGKAADLAVWRIDHPAELSYRMGARPLRARVQGGRWHEDDPR